MNAKQFQSWWLDFSGRFPSKASWVSKQEQASDILRNWQEFLADIDLEDAISANRELHRISGLGDDWDAIPAVVRSTAKVLACARKQSETKQVRTSCPLCDGSGIVTVWLPKIVAAVRDGAEQPRGCIVGDTMGVSCTCYLGNTLAERGIRRFDSQLMVEFGKSINDWLATKTPQPNAILEAYNQQEFV